MNFFYEIVLLEKELVVVKRREKSLAAGTLLVYVENMLDGTSFGA